MFATLATQGKPKRYRMIRSSFSHQQSIPGAIDCIRYLLFYNLCDDTGDKVRSLTITLTDDELGELIDTLSALRSEAELMNTNPR